MSLRPIFENSLTSEKIATIEATFQSSGCVRGAVLDIWAATSTTKKRSLRSIKLRKRGRVWRSLDVGVAGGVSFPDAAMAYADARWDSMELVFYDAECPRPIGAWLAEMPNEMRGHTGFRLVVGSCVSEWLPTRMIAENVSFREAMGKGLKELNLQRATFVALGGRVSLIDAECFVIHRKARSVRSNLRGRPASPTPFAPCEAAAGEALQSTATRELATHLTNWLVANTDERGKLTYIYEPGADNAPSRNNTIRQFMATLCLGRAGRALGRPDAVRAARRNLDYNLTTFYRKRGELGIVFYNGSAKLGAAALAASCIFDQYGEDGEHADALRALVHGIEHLWCDDGWFHTFHLPADRDDNQNFYPGEALLFLATLAAARGDRTLLDRVTKSLWRYRDHHLAARNPAFVPWHTQAAASVVAVTGDEDLALWVFEMNDWLLPIQLRLTPFADMVGCFFDPARPEFGPPHASSTGVYLEGLADATRLAVRFGDHERARSYAEAARLGFAHLAQLQFRDDAEMFYVPRPDLARGGVRTNPWDSSIRADNVQHALAAALKWLAISQSSQLR